MSRRNLILLLPALAVTLVLLFLHSYSVPLGQGSFVYRYSPLADTRVISSLFAVPGIALLYWVIRSADSSRLGTRRTLLAGAAFLYLACFVYFAIPGAIRQHYVNFLSPSHEGAFILETRTAMTATQYVAKFPARQALSIEELRGTRVLSNPPGTTLLAYGIRDSWPPGPLEDYLRQEINLPGEGTTLPALAYKLSAVLTAIWILSAIPVYHAARLLGLPPASALSVVAIVVFSPSAIQFSPGKDPAQLFLVAFQLLGAILAARSTAPRHQAIGAAILGAATTFGVLFSLILLWTGLAAVLFLALSSPRSLPLAAAAGLGASLAVYVVFRVSVGLDLVTTSLAVARRFAEVQPQIKLDLGIWRLIGLPIFLLFVPPALFSLPLLRRRFWRVPRSRTSWQLLAATVPVMAVTYFVGVPYELPRLWVVFIPFLTLGLFAVTPMTYSVRARQVVALLTLLSLLAALAHWTRLDPRESEYRLTSGRHFN